MERHQQELLRLQDVIKLNSVLNALGIDNVREDFRAGRNTSLVSVKPLVPIPYFKPLCDYMVCLVSISIFMKTYCCPMS